jgi:transketolase
MGKGAVKADGSSFERQTSTHGMPLGEAGASFEKSVTNLGGDPDSPFVIFDDVAEIYANRRLALSKEAGERKAAEKAWADANRELAAKLDIFFSGKAPDFDFSSVVQKDHQATRSASSTVLAAFAGKIENLAVASADLSNSDKTDGFLKKTKPFKKGDFSGSFLQAGVAELTMACVMNGMALHGGVIPACGTFFVFSDYMKPAVRLAALMELPVKYIWTHDAFRVGEDGPTHQPVEQEAQIRLMEKLRNHKGNDSVRVLRPADVHETTVAWKMAMENTSAPTALILSRQNITNLPASGNGYESALRLAKGAYVVQDDAGKPDVVLLASGSEVSTLLEGAALLRERDRLNIRVVSVPSEGLFRKQPEEYQKEVLPCGIPRFGLTAGLPVTLQGLVGDKGSVWGMNSFGFSAPYKVLDEKLGFTGENVYVQVKKLLGSK